MDALAIAIGTSHGATNSPAKPTGKVLRIDRVKEIHACIPDVHLVMHGSSSVPEDWLAIINSYGGDMGQTYGVPVEGNRRRHPETAQSQHRHRPAHGQHGCHPSTWPKTARTSTPQVLPRKPPRP